MDWITPAVSLIGGFAQRKAEKRRAKAIREAAERQYAMLRELADPLLQEQRFALPKMRNLIMSQYAPQVGKDDPFLRASHGMNLTNIQRNKERSLANSMRYWQSTGNIGRSRGESLRTLRDATEMANRENLNYGLQQRAFRDAATERYLKGLNLLQGIGAQGLQPMMPAIDAQARGSMGSADALASGDQAMWNGIVGAGRSLGSSLGKASRRMSRTDKQIADMAALQAKYEELLRSIQEEQAGASRSGEKPRLTDLRLTYPFWQEKGRI